MTEIDNIQIEKMKSFIYIFLGALKDFLGVLTKKAIPWLPDILLLAGLYDKCLLRYVFQTARYLLFTEAR